MASGSDEIKKLIQDIGERSRKIQQQASAALIEIGLPAADALIACLMNDPQWEARSCAARILGKINPPGVAPFLYAAMNTDNRSLIEAVLGALVDIQDAGAFDIFIKALEDYATDWNFDIRITAVYGLAKIGDPRAIPALVVALGDQELDVRFEAEEALEIEFGLSAVDALLAILPHEPNFERKYHALRVLAQLDVQLPHAVLEPTMALYLNDPSELIRGMALFVLAELADKNLYPIFAQGLGDFYFLTRLAAIDGLSKLGDKAALLLLEPLRNDPDAQVQKSVAAAIERLNTGED